MASKVFSASLVGLDAVPVEVEADIIAGLPKYSVVGLPDKTVQEARERVRSRQRSTARSGVSAMPSQSAR